MMSKILARSLKDGVLKLSLAIAISTTSSTAFSAVNGIASDSELPTGASVVENASSYLIKIARPNEHGISFNRLSELKANGKDIVLVNSLWGNTKLRDQPAQKIILSVESTSAASFKKLKIDGRAGDVILLSPNGIDCNGCKVENTERVTLATGTTSLDNGQLKTIKTLESGKIRITGDGFEAKQSAIVDFVAGNAEIDGPLVTNLKGRITKVGGQESKQIDPSGPLDVANGDVQVIVGKLNFRYADRQSDAEFSTLSGNALTLTNNADVKVGNLHLESTHENGNIFLDGLVQAKGVWNYIGRYKNQSVIPLESVFVKSNGDITVVDKILATNKVTIDSTNNVFVTPPGGVVEYQTENIWGAEVELVALQKIEVTGAVSAENAHLKAGSVINEGDIETSKELLIDGSAFIKNQFGGVLVGEFIHLKSDNVITNGSLYPYRLTPKTTNHIAARSSYINTIKDGAKLAVPPAPSNMNKVPVSTLSAYILGQNVKVEARDFVNVNPYEVIGSPICTASIPPKCSARLRLDTYESTQVITSAELILDIRLKHHFWNISSIAESWTGNTIIQAPLITNERYSIWADTIKVNHTTQSGNQTTSNDIYVQYIKALSPASKILIGDKALLKSQDFHNNHSAVEIKTDLISDIKNVYQRGLNLRTVWESTTRTEHSRRYCTRKIFGKCIKKSTHWWTTTSIPELTQDESTAKYPFVFLVEGHAHSGFGSNVNDYDEITFGPGGTYTPPAPPKPTKPSRFIPIINSGITFFVPNPNYAAQLQAYLGAK
ncbi:filamentous hemagglutinin N-terminal domain-containing protein [Grimontia kaedaensis]|uniref:Filamentous hemagglutinin N-terminal domain-containing protein n=1 Tax=Grimontia kaedaensis TaxID=2872157 RepID=A0ABY4WXL3_9GAMM|nr:filamentous hemagglutinin N-terminal domain-containing protein [Grimontia kaedaensis]USH03735.1 filamentous hemagglutinin N-terminal domain-containing protein [Grimontia kaedaensis]